MLNRDRQKCLQNTETSYTVSFIVMGVRLEAAKQPWQLYASVKQKSPCILLKILSLHFCVCIKHCRQYV